MELCPPFIRFLENLDALVMHSTVHFPKRWFLAAVITAAGMAVPVHASESGEPAVAPWQIYLRFQHYCTECHGGQLTKPKADMGYILDLRRLIDEAYIIPGAPDDSDLYYALVAEDPDVHMPPPDSDGPKPTPEDIEIIRRWIAEGAPLDDDLGFSAEETGEEKTPPTAGDTLTFPRRIGRFHPLLVHFPIALLLCATAGEVGRRMRPSLDWLGGMARGCLWFGAVAAVVTAVCGWLNAHFEGYSGSTTDIHRWLGISTAVVALFAAFLYERFSRTGNEPSTRGFRFSLMVTLLVAALLVTLAGHTGGILSYGEDYLPFF